MFKTIQRNIWMSVVTLVCFADCYASDPEGSSSLRLRGVLQQNSSEFPFTLILDRSGRMIATIHDQKSDSEMKVYWDNNSVYAEQSRNVIEAPKTTRITLNEDFGTAFPDTSTVDTLFPAHSSRKTTIRKVIDQEAVEMLFDLIAVTLGDHFLGQKKFNFNIELLEDYSVELSWVDSPPDSSTNKKKWPDKLRLIRWESDGSSKLIREFDYKAFKEVDGDKLQPTSMTYLNHTTEESGEITIDNISINPGVPDFLFHPIRNLENYPGELD